MHIRVLYFLGCPHGEPTVELVRRVVALHGLEAAVEPFEVRSEHDPVQLRFLGSPTVQVNGQDADPEARDRTDFAMVCRLYGKLGIPPAQTIADAMREAS